MLRYRQDGQKERHTMMHNNYYYAGRIPAADKKTVYITGARICSEYGRYMARWYGNDLAASGMQVITDLSLGVSGIAARAALKQSDDVFVIMPCGTDVIYPPENTDLYYEVKQKGGILSKYPDGTQVHRDLFNDRREPFWDMFDAVLIIEARKKSSTVKVAEEAAERGIPVYTVPGRATDRLSDGTNALIMNGGAFLTCDPFDLIAAIRERAA